MEASSYQYAQPLMEKETGIIIPVYFPQQIDKSIGVKHLEETVYIFSKQVRSPDHICLSVDGKESGVEVANAISEKSGVQYAVSPVNRGKLNAARIGVGALMENESLNYFAVVDQDGDHFGNELLNFVRTAARIQEQTRNPKVHVLGRRISRHRPMGLLRGELEEFADRMLLDCLNYSAAKNDTPLRLEYANVFDEYPDFHSGYKLFSRECAVDAFLQDPVLAGASEDCYYRHACEAVPIVETLLNGGYLGVVNRSTYNEQPLSTFGLMNRSQLIADKVIWPGKRLEIPVNFIEQWMANHIPRLLLSTLKPDGVSELEEIRHLVMAAFGGGERGSGQVQPVFV